MASVAEYKEFAPENIIGYVRALPPPLPHIGQGILPLRTVDDIKVVWDTVDVKVTAGHLLALDSEIPLDSPPNIQEISQALAKIGKKRIIKEEEKLKLFRPRPGTRDLQSGTDYVYNVLRLLSEGIDERVEEMRWKALSEGTYSYSKYGIVIEVDWGVPVGNKVTPAGAVWSDLENADPLADIIAWNQILIDAVGSSAIVSYCSSTVLGYLLQNTKIQNLIGYSQTGRGAGYPTRKQIETFLLNGEGLGIRPYDAKWNDEAVDGTITQRRFLGETKFVMLASAAGLSPFGLGQVLDGPIPDNNMASGKFSDFYVEREPYREVARCLQMAFPALYVPSAVLIATVHA